MKRFIEQHYILQKNLMMIIGVCLSFYFCYHLMTGPRSYGTLQELESRISIVEKDLQIIQKQRENLAFKVSMMRPGSIDKDLAEEQIRKILGYTYEHEKILLH